MMGCVIQTRHPFIPFSSFWCLHIPFLGILTFLLQIPVQRKKKLLICPVCGPCTMQRKIGRGRAKTEWKLLGQIKNFSEIFNSTAIKGAEDSSLLLDVPGPKRQLSLLCFQQCSSIIREHVESDTCNQHSLGAENCQELVQTQEAAASSLLSVQEKYHKVPGNRNLLSSQPTNTSNYGRQQVQCQDFLSHAIALSLTFQESRK